MLATPNPTGVWRPVVEASWITDFAEAVRQKFGLEITNIRSNETDPPDCFGMVGSRQIGIELVELVNQEILEANARARREGAAIGSGIREFLRAQWTKETFEERIAEVLDKKDQKYVGRACFVDILVVITDENWLDWRDAQEWVSDIEVQQRASIGCAFLLFTHDPTHPQHLPIVRLFGKLPEQQ